MARSRVELFEQIRRDRRVEQRSIRELAERHRVHRRTVRQAESWRVPCRLLVSRAELWNAEEDHAQLKDRAVRLVLDHRDEYPSTTPAAQAVAQ
jgi:hypothetical protein